MFQKADAGELVIRQALARRVRNELAAAGLPVPAPGLSPVLSAGAEVTVDEGADVAGGVFVSWAASPRLQACTSRAVWHQQADDPLLQHSAKVAAAMMQAMATILTSAGFTVEEAGDDQPYELRVADGPDPSAAPAWSLRSGELTRAGQQPAGPDPNASEPR